MDNTQLRTDIIFLLLSTQRPGVDKLIEYLQNETDFFTAPASADFHSNEEGQLAVHSNNVYQLLAEKVKRYNVDIPEASIIISGLMHDLCKTNFYIKTTKSVVDENKPTIEKYFPAKEDPVTKKVLEWGKREVKNWVDKEVWTFDDKWPVGHGEKSVFLLQKFIQLTDEEVAAIRWHMVAFDAGIHFNYPNGYSFRKAMQMYPLVTLLFTADFESSNILEKINKEKVKI